ncbi:hypothetical protein ACEQ8H_002293 [Pleosporales sp. CAS-2024a]
MSSVDAAGFPTPPASLAASSQHASMLPQPRRHALKPGGPKESGLIQYLDRGVNAIQKRVDNRVIRRKTAAPRPGHEEGYASFFQVAHDLDGLVDVVWVSGSPNLQVPYLLNLAVLAAEFLPMFPKSHRSAHATFRLLSKLDEAFSSLLTGHDAATGEQLPGFDSGRSVSTTDKVRLKGIVDRTRLTVARVMSAQSVTGEGSDDDDEPIDLHTQSSPTQPQGTVGFDGFENDDDEGSDEDWAERNIGSIYQKTIGELGDVLGGPPIGIITEDWDSSKSAAETGEPVNFHFDSTALLLSLPSLLSPTMFRDFSFAPKSHSAYQADRAAMTLSPTSKPAACQNRLARLARLPTPPCSMTDLAAKLHQQNLRIDTQLHHASPRPPADPLTPPRHHPRPTYSRVSASLLRMQRQSHSRLQCSPSYTRHISRLVHMIEHEQQCTIGDVSSPSSSTCSLSSPTSSDEGIDMDFDHIEPHDTDALFDTPPWKQGHRRDSCARVGRTVRMRKRSSHRVEKSLSS